MDNRTYANATWEVSRVLWRNRTWAVTEYGVENVAGPYHYFIAKTQLRQDMGEGWPEHMREYDWVNDDDFSAAFTKALELHND